MLVKGTRRVVAAAVIVATALLSWSAEATEPAAADQQTQAERDRTAGDLMRAGTDEYKKGNFEQARVNFLQVWAVKQHPAVAASLGDVEMRLHLYRDAAAHWSFYLVHAPQGPDRAEAETALTECRRYVGSVRLSVDSSGATILLDGNAVGTSPLDSEIWLDAGAHKIEARATDGRIGTEEVALAAGETRDLALVLGPATAGSAQTASPQSTGKPLAPTQPPGASSDESAASSLRIPVVITGSLLTAAAVAIGIVYSSKETQARDDVTHELREVDAATTNEHLKATHGGCSEMATQRPQACSTLRDSVDAVVTNGRIKTAGFVGAGVLGAATIAVYFLWPKAASTGTNAKPSVALMPWTNSGQGIQLRFGF